MFNIYIDADGCPVVEETLSIAEAFSIEAIIVCDTSHELFYEHITTWVVDKGRDAADYVILQNIKKHDIVVTQDYGLASLVLSKQGHPLSQDGLRYTTDNIDQLLFQRMMSAQLRKHKQRVKQQKKRSAVQDDAFKGALEKLIIEVKNNDKVTKENI